MSREVSLEDLNSLNNQINSRINELSLKVNETSTDLKHVQENSSKIHEQTEQIGKLFTKVALIGKDLEILKETVENGKENILNQIKEELATISSISEKYQEVQGQLNQLRLIVEKREREIKERRTRFIVNLIYPIIVGAALIYLGHIIAKSINQNLPQPQKIEQSQH